MELEIVYHIEDARQFWAELEDILQVSSSSTLSRLDTAVRNFVSFCATYHEHYLQTPVQLEHACCLLLDSEIFNFHSERLSSLVITDALSDTDPHAQLILHHVLLLHGQRHVSFFRSAKKWSELIPVLMDHILLVDVDDGYNSGSSNAWRGGIGVPIEARLRQLAVRILYEVCRVQKFDLGGLRIFKDVFIDRLFDLVEVTRDMQDETLNYCLIKLIVALNEQFMVSALQTNKSDANHKDNAHRDNRVIQVLMRRLNSSKTFGENLIFMLNRADQSAEDRCMQLLILKILYLLFTTPETQEYFYTNDLHVLVDVFLRELVDLDEDSESLRHTYLRVLHPLLTHTQLRNMPYKRPQILRTLESLVAHAEIRDVSPTTRRLVERCLGGAWAVQLRKDREAAASSGKAAASSASTPNMMHTTTNNTISTGGAGIQSSTYDRITISLPVAVHASPTHPLKDERYIKLSKSVDNVVSLKSPKEGVGVGLPSGGYTHSHGFQHHHRDDLLVMATSNQKKPKSKANKSSKVIKPKAVVTNAAGTINVYLGHMRPGNESAQSLVSVAGAASGSGQRAPSVSSLTSVSSSSPLRPKIRAAPHEPADPSLEDVDNVCRRPPTDARLRREGGEDPPRPSHRHDDIPQRGRGNTEAGDGSGVDVSENGISVRRDEDEDGNDYEYNYEQHERGKLPADAAVTQDSPPRQDSDSPPPSQRPSQRSSSLPPGVSTVPSASTSISSSPQQQWQHRPAPAPPLQRRKPPAVPSRSTKAAVGA